MSDCIINKLQCSLDGMASRFILNLGCSCFASCCVFEVVLILSFFLSLFLSLSLFFLSFFNVSLFLHISIFLSFAIFLAGGHCLIGRFVTRSIIVITFDLYQLCYGQNSKIENTLKSGHCL